MKLSTIVLKIRQAGTTFGNYVAGAAEFALAQSASLSQEAAFVVQLSDAARPNEMDSGIVQKITERFGVVVALKNDNSLYDRLGITAFDRLHDIRAELFTAILGWQITGMESVVYYSGARLMDVHAAWLWYMFEFEAVSVLDEDDGVLQEDADDFLSMYTQYIIDPALRPLNDVSLPTELAAPGLSHFVRADHGFSDGFSTGFDTVAAWANK